MRRDGSSPRRRALRQAKCLITPYTRKMHENGRSCIFERVCSGRTRRGETRRGGNRQREKWTNKICIKPGKRRVLEDEKDGGCQNGPNRARESETKKDRKQ